MRYLSILWVVIIIGLVGVYDGVVNLQTTISNQEIVIKKLKTNQDTWYKSQIEMWVPYEFKLKISNENMGQCSYAERAKQ